MAKAKNCGNSCNNFLVGGQLLFIATNFSKIATVKFCCNIKQLLSWKENCCIDNDVLPEKKKMKLMQQLFFCCE
jgi:hypothetical protein